MSSLIRRDERFGLVALIVVLGLVVPRSLAAVDCNQNGIDDAVEIASGRAMDCNRNGIPDGCDMRGSFGFDAVAEFPLAILTDAFATGDFDGDGRADIAGAGESGNLVVYLARSRWSVESTIVNAAGPVVAIVAADFNRDGRDDLAAAVTGPSAESGFVSVFLNRGGAVFEPARSIEVGEGVNSLAAADFDGDGTADLACACAGTRDVWALRSQGDGSLDVVQRMHGGLAPRSVLAADFTGDGRPDLACASPTEGLVVPFRNIGGEFDMPDPAVPGEGASGLAAADFDGDGDLDLVTLVSGPSAVAYLENLGPSFALPVLFDGGREASGLVAADFDGDGAPDLAVANAFEPGDRPGVFSILAWSQAARRFAAPVEYPTSTPRAVASADLDGDGRADVLVAGRYGPRVHVNRIEPLFDYGDELGRGPDKILRTVGAGDLDGDGALDLAVENAGYGDNNDPGATQVLWNDGDGRFTNAVSLDDGRVHGEVRIADFDGDQRNDLAIAGTDDVLGSGIFVYFGAAGGGFDRVVVDTAETPSWLAIGDLDQDGRPDLASGSFAGSSSRLSIFLYAGARSFAVGPEWTPPGYPVGAGIRDLNADGLADVVTVSFDGLAVFLQDAKLSFRAAGTYPVSLYARNVVFADLTLDGAPELVTQSEVGSAVLWFLNRGDGTFAQAESVRVNGPAFGVAAEDFDLNGYVDLVSASYPASLSVLRADGPGSFSLSPLASGRDPFAVVAADWSGDGLADIAAAHFGGVSLLRNHSVPPVPDADDNGVLDICESVRFERGDIDATGDLDLSDAVFLIQFLFLGGAPPPCNGAADANGDRVLDLSDAIYVLAYLFLGGAEPPAPFPGCGMELDLGDLGCDTFPPCE